MAAIGTQPSGILNSRSKIYYKFTGLSSDSTYSVELYIDGTLYISTARTPNVDSEIVIDVRNPIKNYLSKNLEYDTNLTVQVYVKLIEDGSAVLTSNTITCTLGYTQYHEGINYSHGSKYQACSDQDIIELPNYGDTINSYWITYMNPIVTSTWDITYTNTGGTTSQITEFFDYVTDPEFQKIPCGYSNFTDYGVYDVDITKPFTVEIYEATTKLRTKTITPLVCNGNDLNYLIFINRYGAWDQIFITGKVSESNSSDYETYEYDNLDYSTMDYKRNGSVHKFVTNGVNSLSMNSGWVSEDMNEKFEQLLLSENVYYNDKPIIITSKNIKYKTHRFDKLINYDIQADFAYNTINKI